MSDRYLVYGCGELTWVSRTWDETFAQFNADPGRHPESFELGDGPSSSANVTVSIAEELDARVGWTLARDPVPPQVQIQSSSGLEAPLLPSWEELVHRQAEAVTNELRSAGVLVTPESYRDAPAGRSLLAAWTALGWRWAGLEAVLARHAPAAARWVSASGCWLRVREPEGSAVVPNGLEAALASHLAGPLLERLLDAVPGELAQAWQQDEEPKSGWFTRQRLTSKLREALLNDRRSLDLGGPEAPLFAFSTSEARGQFQALSALWMAVKLPPVPTTIWWEQLAQPGVLRPPGGKGRLTGFQWDALETIVVDQWEKGGSSTPTTEDLQNYLRFNQRRLRPLSLWELNAALSLGTDLSAQLVAWRKQEEREGGPSGGDAPTFPPDPLAGFALRDIRLLPNHRFGSLKVWIEDQQVAADNLAADETEAGERIYQIRGQALRHGDLVRLDYEPDPTGGVEP